MATARNVAKRLLWMAAQEDEPDYLSHLRLQKLLYYAQGWSLAKRDKPLFNDKIEAWAHGPVVAKLFSQFADYKYLNIPPTHFQNPDGTVDAGDLTKDESAFVDAVWSAYKKYSATSLRSMTHDEKPWRDARGDCGPADKCTNEITKDAIKKFFKSRG